MSDKDWGVSYDRQTINTPNPIARFAHRRRTALGLALLSSTVPRYGAVADFGPGDGYMLHCLGQQRPDLKLYGIEDTMTSAYPEIVFTRDFSGIPDKSLAAVTAFEVMEHMLDSEIIVFIRDVARVLEPGGMLIVSVPVMMGAALPLKEINRLLLYRRGSEYSVKEFFRGIAGLPVTRPPDPRPTHKGFDFRVLRTQLEQFFKLETLIRSPVRPLPWWLNSQVFFCMRRTIAGHEN
jgi:hypothetical protein